MGLVHSLVRLSRAIWRMEEPAAITSIPLILPTISKPMGLWAESYTREVVERSVYSVEIR
jgi:hypothetical protein